MPDEPPRRARIGNSQGDGLLSLALYTEGVKDQRITTRGSERDPVAEARKQVAYYTARIEEERAKAARETDPRIKSFHIGLIGLYEDCLTDYEQPKEAVKSQRA